MFFFLGQLSGFNSDTDEQLYISGFCDQRATGLNPQTSLIEFGGGESKKEIALHATAHITLEQGIDQPAAVMSGSDHRQI